jgi:hypothetical protein
MDAPLPDSMSFSLLHLRHVFIYRQHLPAFPPPPPHTLTFTPCLIYFTDSRLPLPAARTAPDIIIIVVVVSIPFPGTTLCVSLS